MVRVVCVCAYARMRLCNYTRAVMHVFILTFVCNRVGSEEQAVVSLAAAKCNDVPVLVLVKNAEAVHRVAQYVRQDLGAAWGDGTGGVIELLHNPRNPREFVDLVDLSTEPLQVAQDKHAFRVTVTTADVGYGVRRRVVVNSCRHVPGGISAACRLWGSSMWGRSSIRLIFARTSALSARMRTASCFSGLSLAAKPMWRS